MVTDRTEEPKKMERRSALRRYGSFNASARKRPSATKAGVVRRTK
jgi:hypothetical protein